MGAGASTQRYVAEGLGKLYTKVTSVDAIFRACDVDLSGDLDLPQSQYALQALGFYPTELELEALLGQAEQRGQNLALLKLGRRWRWLRPLLEQRGLLSRSLFAEKVGWPDQVIAPAEQIQAGERPYFSLLLIRQRWPDVLP